MAICRAIAAFGICPPIALGTAVVQESFFKKDRGRYMGIWTLMVTLGVPTAPFVFGFVTYYTSYRWIYWILAIVNGVQLVLYIFLGPETRYLRKGEEHVGSDFRQEYLLLGRIDPRPIKPVEFVAPLKLCFYPNAIIPAIAYAVVFLFANVMVSVEIPQLFVPKFHFNARQLGLQFLGIIIGSVLGEQVGGIASDLWMLWRSKKTRGKLAAESRLWLSYIGFFMAMLDIVLFLTLIARAREGEWNVGPVVGSGVAAAGNQIVTTILITYAIDCLPDEASSVGVLINVVRQLLGFTGPFWFPKMFSSAGLGGSAGISAGLIFAFSIVPTVFLQWKGEMWR